jgi:Fe-S-cluster containining protein
VNSERRFACVEGCTACCRRPGTIVLTREDAARIAGHFQLSLRQFHRRYTDRVHGEIRLRLVAMQCPFLGGDESKGWCNIHAVKPVQCSTYPFWPGVADSDRGWRREMAMCPGIGQGETRSREWIQIQIAAAAPTATGR